MQNASKRYQTYRDKNNRLTSESENIMTKRIRAKYKIDRRLRVNLWGRPKSPFNSREYGPGLHGQRRKKQSDFGLQLQAKQKLERRRNSRLRRRK